MTDEDDRRERYEERAAIREYCGRQTRAEAEAGARLEVYGATPPSSRAGLARSFRSPPGE